MTTTLSDAVGEYVGRCIQYVQDLPEPARSDVVDDVRQIVHEVSAELDGRPEDLLGPPDRFVGELRVAAGLAAAVPDRSQARPSLMSRLGAGAERFRNRVDVGTVVAWLRELARELRPAGWVMRGYLLGVWLCFSLLGFADLDWLFGVVPVPSSNGSVIGGAAVIAALIVASVEAGRRRPRGWKRAAVVVATVVSVMALWSTVDSLRGGWSVLDRDVVAYTEVPTTTVVLAEAVSGTVPEALGDTTQEQSDMAVVTSASGRVIYLESIGAAEAAWHDLTDGSLLQPVVVRYRGFSASVSSPDALVEVLASWGLGDT